MMYAAALKKTVSDNTVINMWARLLMMSKYAIVIAHMPVILVCQNVFLNPLYLSGSYYYVVYLCVCLQISMSVSVAVLSVTTILRAVIVMAVMSVLVTLDSLEMESTASVR